MNQALSTDDYNNLGKSKLLVSGSGAGVVPREVGISMIVRLYELKTKYPVTGFPSINETGYTDISTADAQYRTPLLKAVELGFYRSHTASPKSALTFGDLMHMLDIVLSY